MKNVWECVPAPQHLWGGNCPSLQLPNISCPGGGCPAGGCSPDTKNNTLELSAELLRGQAKACIHQRIAFLVRMFFFLHKLGSIHFFSFWLLFNNIRM